MEVCKKRERTEQIQIDISTHFNTYTNIYTTHTNTKTEYYLTDQFERKENRHFNE